MKIKPTEVSIGSHKKVIWRCENRTRMDSCR
ncbi:MAG: zinc-ribbon domain-containing protein [Enterocloster clostridioformis]